MKAGSVPDNLASRRECHLSDGTVFRDACDREAVAGKEGHVIDALARSRYIYRSKRGAFSEGCIAYALEAGRKLDMLKTRTLYEYKVLNLGYTLRDGYAAQ